MNEQTKDQKDVHILCDAVLKAAKDLGIARHDLDVISPTEALFLLEDISRPGAHTDTKDTLVSPVSLELANDSKGNGTVARISRTGDGEDYKEVAIDFFDADGRQIACMLAGLDPDRLTPKISITTDAMGDCDFNIIVDPTAPAEEAVLVYEEQSRAQREAARQDSASRVAQAPRP